jgi:hypothetical protein
MSSRAWRKTGGGKVPEAKGVAWTQVVETVTPGKLLKILVKKVEKRGEGTTPVVEAEWQPPVVASGCTADGVTFATQPNVVLVGAPAGCLIGRIGGSTADMQADPVSVSPATRIMFAAGRFCVLSVPASFPGGALFLAANDSPDQMSKVEGQLEVEVFESL